MDTRCRPSSLRGDIWLRPNYALLSGAGLGALFIITFSGLLPSQGYAQSIEELGSNPRYVQEAWTVKDGLPVNALSRLLQSSNGYLWLASHDGLIRFDGVSFTVFNTSNTPSLVSNRIADLIETPDGVLWLRTEDHRLIQYTKGGFKTCGVSDGLPQGFAFSMYQDEAGTLWVGTLEGLRYWNGSSLTPFASQHVGEPVNKIIRTQDGSVWAGGIYSALFQISPGEEVTRYDGRNGFTDKTVNALHEATDSTLWIGTKQDGFFSWKNGAFTRVEIAGMAFPATGTAFFEDPAGTQYLVTEQHLYQNDGSGFRWFSESVGGYGKHIIDGEGGRWFYTPTHLYLNNELVRVFEHGIQDLLFDHEGHLWIATAHEGLHQLRPALVTTLTLEDGLVGRNAYAVLEDQAGELWVSTTHGLSRYTNGRFVNYSQEDLPNRSVRALFEDSQQRLWVSFWGPQPPCIFEPDRSACIPFSHPELSHMEAVHAMFEDLDGRFWMGTENDLLLRENDTWTRVASTLSLPTFTYRQITQSRDGAVWFGTNGAGLVRYRDGEYQTLNKSDGLPSNLIRAIYEDEDGILWIGTEERGLARIALQGSNLKDALITSYTRNIGLFDDVIHAITEDKSGRLWMSTNRGIFWVERDILNRYAAGEIESIFSTGYAERDGMKSREANGGTQPSFSRCFEGNLCFPTQNGVVYLNPEEATPLANPSSVLIEAVSSNYEALPVANELHLAADQRSFTISYTAPSFHAPESIRFRYRLLGYDPDWIDAGTRREAFYTKVPPGNYTFYVEASTHTGYWVQSQIPLTLAVAPYFFEAWWFYVSIIVSVVALIGISYSWRVRMLRVREQNLEKLVSQRTQDLENERKRTLAALTEAQEANMLKTMFLANMSHEIRTPLTGIIGFAGIMVEESSGHLKEFSQLIQRSGKRLMDTLNSVLDLSRLEAGEFKLLVQPLDLRVEALSVIEEMQMAADDKSLRLEMAAPPHPVMVLVDPAALGRIITNLTSNAIKFTSAGSVIVHVQIDKSWGILAIEDTGVGISESFQQHLFHAFRQESIGNERTYEGVGLGLRITKELVELMQGNISVSSEKGKGSVFTVRLPLATAHAGSQERAQNARPIKSTKPTQ